MRAEDGFHNKTLGEKGENIAVTFLEAQRFVILERNFRCKAGEVDIVARDGSTLVFVEVKTRRSYAYGVPQLAVTPFKQRQICKASLTWLAKNKRYDNNARFDVVAITLTNDVTPRIEHIKNAFDLVY